MRPRHGLELQEKPPVPFYALLAFGSESWDWNGVRAVVHGVSVPQPVPLAFRDLSVLVSAEEIEADVHFNTLRTTPALERILEILNTVGARMATDLMARPEQIGFDQSEVAARIFEDLSHFYQRQQRQGQEQQPDHAKRRKQHADQREFAFSAANSQREAPCLYRFSHGIPILHGRVN